MRFLTFFVGVMLCILGIEISQATRAGWWIFWNVTLFSWFFICLVAGVVSIVGRALSRKPPAPFAGMAPRPAGKPGPGDE